MAFCKYSAIDSTRSFLAEALDLLCPWVIVPTQINDKSKNVCDSNRMYLPVRVFTKCHTRSYSSFLSLCTITGAMHNVVFPTIRDTVYIDEKA